LSAWRLAVCVALFTGLTQAASAAEILIGDAKSQPESLTVAPGGTLIVGSASTPFVYKVRPGFAAAEKFIDAPDASNNRLRALARERICDARSSWITVGKSHRRQVISPSQVLVPVCWFSVKWRLGAPC
jgi:hypothetical protein